MTFQPLSDGGYSWTMNRNLQSTINRNLQASYNATYPAPNPQPMFNSVSMSMANFQPRVGGFQPGFNNNMAANWGSNPGFANNSWMNYNWAAPYYRPQTFANYSPTWGSNPYGPSWGYRSGPQFDYFSGQNGQNASPYGVAGSQ